MKAVDGDLSGCCVREACCESLFGSLLVPLLVVPAVSDRPKLGVIRRPVEKTADAERGGGRRTIPTESSGSETFRSLFIGLCVDVSEDSDAVGW